jgi:hypothetical protein
MGIYAMVYKGVVKNVAIWDGESGWPQPDGISLIPVKDGDNVSPGFTYDPATEKFSSSDKSAMPAT